MDLQVLYSSNMAVYDFLEGSSLPSNREHVCASCCGKSGMQSVDALSARAAALWETSVDIPFITGGVHGQTITFDLRCRMRVSIDHHVLEFVDDVGHILGMGAFD